MPAYLPVPSLSFLSLESTADIVLTTLSVLGANTDFNLEEVCEKRVQDVADYLTELPPSVAEELMHHILRLEDLDAPVRYYVLKMLLQPLTKTLAIGIFPQAYYSKIVSVISRQGTGLQMLDLKGVWLKGKDCCQLQRLLENIPTLTALYIPHMATDAALQTLGRHGTALQMLDMSGESSITERGVRLLCSSVASTLHVINIGNTGGEEVKPETVAQLIKHLPNLTSLGTYAHVGKALLCLQSEETVTVGKTNLQYIHDSFTDREVIKIIVRVCPKLESIYLDQPCTNVIPQLHLIPKLNHIKIHKFLCEELFSLLAKCGRNLISVELILGTGILNLSLVGTECPQLSKLVCYKIECIRHFENTPFKNLRRLGIFYSDLTTSCAKYIISSAPNLEELSIGDSLDVTDIDIHEIFSKTQFVELRDVWFPNARNLTTLSLQTFIQQCPNLRSLGELSGWDLSPSDVNEFRAAIQAENIDLKLWEYFG